ncbi:hypothetical protein LTR64_005115 [Lithohypha guttulata]|uniref:uncharacterized protein n=1 Tax=Lithohypha guttulata TaxID=1690604 RepID=UPI002DE06128|nr:hypothetical protein LTR51_005051 [Lithohypha guttulata]
MPPNTNGRVKEGGVQHVGYIGLGNAGFSMASNLPKAGYTLVVHDADEAKAERAANEWKNTKAAHGQAEAFSDCEVVVTMLPQGKIVREVLFGQNGIAKALKAGTIVVDTSSSSPFDTVALGKELAEHSLQLVDAPITQTYMHATDAGESTLMVGSDSEDAYQKIEPVLRTMASYIFHMGRLGSGHAMKTLNNYIMASSLVALSDSFVTGQQFGLDPQKMIDCLNVGTALLVKDLGITQEFMKHNQFETELPGVIRKYLSDALEQVEPQADHTKMLVGWEKRAGISLRKTEKAQSIPEADFTHRLHGLNRP